ncbi:peptidase M24 [Athelia psychrophila]|uniref:Peptidase M24 n=1 Tax=Athelia psychrophila TaxID=1759441 RepID=A0A166M4W2_9AGAM|nr:peptidase M24 [Fibularhizoctonia sp. CBS 109695]
MTLWLGLDVYLHPNISHRSPDFTHLGRHCAHTSAIGPSEYHARQKALAKRLQATNASAYIAEPGANAHFFGNISKSHWGLSERPLLLIISPNEGEAKVTVLTPAFEASRAKLLPIPSAFQIEYVEWAEDKNPYDVALRAVLQGQLGQESQSQTIFVDGDIRHFIVDGLQDAAPSYNVASAPMEVRSLRERKSNAEIDLMKCANEVTVLAIRAVREHMYIGIRESQVRALLSTALFAAGITESWMLVLFGENAALPHGRGSDRTLEKSDFTLIDAGGLLHGYSSDVTRTFALSSSEIPLSNLKIWDAVKEAQNIAAATARAGVVTGKVDETAREYLATLGYAQYFTHRLGHGIGTETHEQPYLRGGSQDVIQTGHAFSNEPGVYIEGQVGVRLEDCFYISGDGAPVFLTAGVGGQAEDAWHP